MLDYIDQVHSLLDLSDDELYQRLGADLAGNQALPLDPRDLADRGKRYFATLRPKLESAICDSPYARHFADGKSDAADIAIEVLKLISSLALPFSPVALGVLVAKKGIRTFCEVRWNTLDHKS